MQRFIINFWSWKFEDFIFLFADISHTDENENDEENGKITTDNLSYVGKLLTNDVVSIGIYRNYFIIKIKLMKNIILEMQSNSDSDNNDVSGLDDSNDKLSDGSDFIDDFDDDLNNPNDSDDDLNNPNDSDDDLNNPNERIKNQLKKKL